MFNYRGNIFAFVVDPSIKLNEREIIKFIAKVKDEVSSQSIKLFYVVFEKKMLNFRSHINCPEEKPVFSISFESIRRIEFYRDILVMRYVYMTQRIMTGEKKLDFHSPIKDDEPTNELFSKKAKYIDEDYKSTYILLTDEQEFTKWSMLLIRPLEKAQPGTLHSIDSNDDGAERKTNLWSMGNSLLSFDHLERYAMNSQYVLNPTEGDKVALYERINMESKDFNELFDKYNSK